MLLFYNGFYFFIQFDHFYKNEPIVISKTYYKTFIGFSHFQLLTKGGRSHDAKGKNENRIKYARLFAKTHFITK